MRLNRNFDFENSDYGAQISISKNKKTPLEMEVSRFIWDTLYMGWANSSDYKSKYFDQILF